jgi:signal peptidase I
MKKHLYTLLIALPLMLILAACGNDDEFTIKGKIKDNPTLNLRFVYYGQGALQTGITAANEGEFEFHGNSKRPTIVEIFDNDYRLMGRVYTVNGETIECQLDRNEVNNIKMSGNAVVEEWAKFLNKNAEGLRLRGRIANRLVADYIKANPDNVLSSILLMTSYDASEYAVEADSLLNLIKPSARPNDLVGGYNFMIQRLVSDKALGKVVPIPYFVKGDSVRIFNPSRSELSLIALSNSDSGRPDSILPALRRLHNAASDSKLKIIDISVDQDTMAWQRSTRQDSAKWTQGWVAGSVASPGINTLGIARIPYFIVCDSSGKQVYRGPSIKEAEKLLNSKL